MRYLKYFLLLTTVIIWKNDIACSQNISNLSKTYSYKFFADAAMQSCDITGKVTNDTVETLPSGSIIVLINTVEKGEKKVIRFWIWKDAELAQKFNYIDNVLEFDFTDNHNTKRRKYFLIDSKDLDEKSVPYYPISLIPSFTAGTVILPIKIRFNEFDFSKDITIGPTAGAKWRISRFKENYLNVLCGFGITSVTLDSLSTKGKIRTISDRPALTPTFGFVMEYNTNVQIGIFIGKDFLSAKEQTNWIYDRKTWLSIGLGYSILSKSSEQKSIEGTNSN